jgi:hypothetical protein
MTYNNQLQLKTTPLLFEQPMEDEFDPEKELCARLNELGYSSLVAVTECKFESTEYRLDYYDIDTDTFFKVITDIDEIKGQRWGSLLTTNLPLRLIVDEFCLRCEDCPTCRSSDPYRICKIPATVAEILGAAVWDGAQLITPEELHEWTENE